MISALDHVKKTNLLDCSFLELRLIGDERVRNFPDNKDHIRCMTKKYGDIEQIIEYVDRNLSNKVDVIFISGISHSFMKVAPYKGQVKLNFFTRIYEEKISPEDLYKLMETKTKMWNMLYPNLLIYWIIPFPVDFLCYLKSCLSKLIKWSADKRTLDDFDKMAKNFYYSVSKVRTQLKNSDLLYIDLCDSYFENTNFEDSFSLDNSVRPKFISRYTNDGVVASDTFLRYINVEIREHLLKREDILQIVQTRKVKFNLVEGKKEVAEIRKEREAEAQIMSNPKLLPSFHNIDTNELANIIEYTRNIDVPVGNSISSKFQAPSNFGPQSHSSISSDYGTLFLDNVSKFEETESFQFFLNSLNSSERSNYEREKLEMIASLQKTFNLFSAEPGCHPKYNEKLKDFTSYSKMLFETDDIKNEDLWLSFWKIFLKESLTKEMKTGLEHLKNKLRPIRRTLGDIPLRNNDWNNGVLNDHFTKGPIHEFTGDNITPKTPYSDNGDIDLRVFGNRDPYTACAQQTLNPYNENPESFMLMTGRNLSPPPPPILSEGNENSSIKNFSTPSFISGNYLHPAPSPREDDKKSPLDNFNTLSAIGGNFSNSETKMDPEPQGSISLTSFLEQYELEKVDRDFSSNVSYNSRDQLSMNDDRKRFKRNYEAENQCFSERIPIPYMSSSYQERAECSKSVSNIDTDVYSVSATLELLEKGCENIGLIGRTLQSVLSQMKSYDVRKKLSSLLEKDNKMLINIVLKKLQSLPPNSVFDKTVLWTMRLLDQAEKAELLKSGRQSSNDTRDIEEIGNATAGMDASDILQYIVNFYKSRKSRSLTEGELQVIFQDVSAIHFQKAVL